MIYSGKNVEKHPIPIPQSNLLARVSPPSDPWVSASGVRARSTWASPLDAEPSTSATDRPKKIVPKKMPHWLVIDLPL